MLIAALIPGKTPWVHQIQRAAVAGYRSIEVLAVSLSWALGERHLEFDVFIGLIRGFASVLVSDKFHWDHTTPQRALCYPGAAVTRGCWQREQPRAPGGLCCSLTAACVVAVLFWPWDKFVLFC